MATELEKIKKRLAKVEAELDKCRTSVIDDGWQTQKFANKSRKWDYYAQEKMRLKARIEELELQEKEDAERENMYCVSCGAVLEMECACSESED